MTIFQYGLRVFNMVFVIISLHYKLINQVLVKLLQLEKIEKIGLSRGTRYRVK